MLLTHIEAKFLCFLGDFFNELLILKLMFNKSLKMLFYILLYSIPSGYVLK